MKLGNPWVDPRVAQVRVADFEKYLVKRGWSRLEKSPPYFLSFEIPGDRRSLIRIPADESDRNYLRLVIEVITDMARVEDKYAVEILNDILSPSSSPSPPSFNGIAHEPALASSEV